MAVEKITVPEPEQKNRMVCMKFYTMHPHAVYIAIPPTMPDFDACELTKQRLSKLDAETFRRLVVNGDIVVNNEEGPWDPWPEDFVDMHVDPECNQQSADFTDKPTGTLGR